MLKVVNTFGRALGALCGALLAVAWAFALWVPTAGLTLVGVSVVTALLLCVLALLAVIASLRGHPTVLVLLFLASFFPVGLFLMRVDHWLRWSGWADLGLLVAAALLWTTRGAVRPGAPAGEAQ
jgi:hypothetical protein